MYDVNHLRWKCLPDEWIQMQRVLQCRHKDLDRGRKKLKRSQRSITKLTKTGRAIMIWFISCITCAPSYRHHPFTLCITVHPGSRPTLGLAVRYTGPGHWHQSCRLCPWGRGHIRGQVQSCCGTAAIKYGHTHEWHTCSTVYYSQHKSERERERRDERRWKKCHALHAYLSYKAEENKLMWID